MKVEMEGSIVNVSARVDASSNLVKRVVLEVQGDISSLQDLMKVPIVIAFEPMQMTIGRMTEDADAQIPEEADSR